MLRIADTDKPCLHLVYDMWDTMIENVKNVIFKHDNIPLHCLAHSLNPRYYTNEWLESSVGRVAPHNDVEISNEMNKCFKRYFPNADDRRKVLVEYVKFSSMRGEFGEYDSIVDGSQLDPPFWWLIHGTCTPTLKSIAIKLLSQPTSSSCCERNWGTCSFIHSMRRNKITPKCAEDLVFVHNNFSFLSRNTQPYKEGPTKMRDIGGDAIETPDGAGLLEVANLSLDELTFESIVFADERDEIDDDIED
ncbi:hypothetical protein M5689_000958 [Euphorbia peplus]|nr:hypothetical protein M5689_000958 [Euphorbia peplus]